MPENILLLLVCGALSLFAALLLAIVNSLGNEGSKFIDGITRGAYKHERSRPWLAWVFAGAGVLVLTIGIYRFMTS